MGATATFKTLIKFLHEGWKQCQIICGRGNHTKCQGKIIRHNKAMDRMSSLTQKYTIGAVVMGKMKENKDMGATMD
jgi:hypothetical protein